MGAKKAMDIENLIFSYIDELKFLFFPDKWSKFFLDFSKNEILSLIFLYRNKGANMTEISEYINAPLNTTTGVVNRLLKKNMVERVRSEEDRRVIKIILTQEAVDLINKEKEVLIYYFKKVYEKLTIEEKTAAMSIFSKAIEVLYSEKRKLKDGEKAEKKVRKIIIE